MAFTFHQALIILLALLVGSTSRTSQAEPQLRGRLLDQASSAAAKHESWSSSHNRVYKDSAEKDKRQKIFEKNAEFIDKFNSKPNRSFKLKTNKFADLTNQEFHKTRTGGFQMMNLTRSLTSATMSFPSEYRTQGLDYGEDYSTSSSSSVDWRENNAVTPIKEQGQCGSCWAFATVATVESVTYIKTGNLPTLSEQQLVDCVTGDNTRGCHGGNQDEAFTYITQNGGIASESSYPYTATDGPCAASQHSPAATVAGYVDVPPNDEEALRYAVSQQPVTAFVNSKGGDFQFYASGVYDGGCGTALDHVVAVVGYGETEDGVPYWLVRNSWGTDWGEEGYMRLLRNAGTAEGQCGIAMYASYPTV